VEKSPGAEIMNTARHCVDAEMIGADPRLRLAPILGWPPHLTSDSVIWWPNEARWIGWNSPHLAKKIRKAAAKSAAIRAVAPS
jgi:hypothetical protein